MTDAHGPTGPNGGSTVGVVEPVDRGTAAVLHGMLATLSEVLGGLDQRLAALEGSVTAIGPGLRTLTEVHQALVDHPAIRLEQSMADVVAQVGSLIAQPGPGPAMAMVAAGLSERFEARTGELAALVERLAGRVDDASTHLAPLAQQVAALNRVVEDDHAVVAGVDQVMRAQSDAVEAMGGHQQALAAAMGELVTSVEGRQASLDGLAGTLHSLAVLVEGLGARLEETRDAALVLGDAGTTLPARTREEIAGLLNQVADRQEVVLAHLSDRQEEVITHLADRQVELGAAVQALTTSIAQQQADLAAVQNVAQGMAAALERSGTVGGQVAELLLENRAAVKTEVDRLQGLAEGQGTSLSALDHRLRHMEASVQQVLEQLRAAPDLDERVGQVEAGVRSVLEQLADLRQLGGKPPAAPATGIVDLDTTAVSEVVRSEAELLTQRVAALSVSVETLRSMLAAHIDDTANSIGRKATEAGRRLVADLGIKPKAKPDRTSRRDGRELGRG